MFSSKHTQVNSYVLSRICEFVYLNHTHKLVRWRRHENLYSRVPSHSIVWMMSTTKLIAKLKCTLGEQNIGIRNQNFDSRYYQRHSERNRRIFQRKQAICDSDRHKSRELTTKHNSKAVHMSVLLSRTNIFREFNGKRNLNKAAKAQEKQNQTLFNQRRSYVLIIIIVIQIYSHELAWTCTNMQNDSAFVWTHRICMNLRWIHESHFLLALKLLANWNEYYFLP